MINSKEEHVFHCMECDPIKLIHNTDGVPTIPYIAKLEGTPMIDGYRGCGEATAYVKNGYWVAWHYGADNASYIPEGTTPYKVDASSRELCFYEDIYL